MNNSTNNPMQSKREFYNRPEVANSYDEQRFSGASGAWVNAREIELALSLVPSFHRALDLGCGTGRLTRSLAERGPTVGMDASSAMLARAQATGVPLVQGDGFALPFADGNQRTNSASLNEHCRNRRGAEGPRSSPLRPADS